MIRWFNNLRRKARRGQATAEYIIIVALIAIAGIVVVKLFGQKIRDIFTKSTDQLTTVEQTVDDSGGSGGDDDDDDGGL